MTSSPNPDLLRAGQSLTPGDLVHLYVIDLSPIGVSAQFAFIPATDRQATVRFGGVEYRPLDIRCEGFEVSSDGSLPQPTVSITNVTRVMSSAAVLYDDLLRARLIRTRTYAQFLDDGSMADPGAYYARDIYSFHQKVEHNKRQITWRLAAAMDQEGVQVPRRVILRDTCLKKYRRWTGSGFDYSNVECPYTGDQSYDVNGNPVSPDRDAPSRQLNTCCKVRFGAGARLPFGGFPGVGRTRV